MFDPPEAPLPAGQPTDDRGVTAEQVAEIAAAVADLRLERARAASARLPGGLRPIEVVLIGLLAASLLLHALTITRLFAVRNTLRDQIDELASSVEGAKQSTITYQLPINQQLPINLDVPISRNLNVPIKTSVRLQQTIDLPIDTPLGSFNVPVPVDATIPIDTSVPINFDQTIAISATVPIKLDLPIQVDLGASQVAPLLDRLRERLIELRDSL